MNKMNKCNLCGWWNKIHDGDAHPSVLTGFCCIEPKVIKRNGNFVACKYFKLSGMERNANE